MTPRARALREAILDKVAPKCRIPGCPFRGRTCAVHDYEEEVDRGFDSMVRDRPHGGGKR